MTGDCKDSGCGCSHKHEKTATVTAKAGYGVVFETQPLFTIDKKGSLYLYMPPADKTELGSQKLTQPDFESRLLLIAETTKIAHQEWLAMTEEMRDACLRMPNRPDLVFTQACAFITGDWNLNDKNKIVFGLSCNTLNAEVHAQLESCMLFMRAAIAVKVAGGMLLNLNGIWLDIGPTDTLETVEQAYHDAFSAGHLQDFSARCAALDAHMAALPEALKNTFTAFVWLCRYVDVINDLRCDVRCEEVVTAFLAAGYSAVDSLPFNEFTASQWAAELINRSMLHLQQSEGAVTGERLVVDFLKFYVVGSPQHRAAVTVLERAGLVVAQADDAEPATHVVETPAADVEQKELSASAQEATAAQS